MKIGVITFWSSQDNYGQLLQCYALQTYLKAKGHDVFLIRYQSTSTYSISFKWRKIFIYLRKFHVYLSLFMQMLSDKYKRCLHSGKDVNNNLRKFNEFVENNIVCTDDIYTEKELNENPPMADVYICGSDQIWGGNDLVYYLSFAPEESIKIAYAPSFGGIDSFTPEYELDIKKCLSHFSFLGIREQSGVEFCHRLGFVNAVKVVDPTLLLKKEDYDLIRINTDYKNKKPYVFLYILGNPMACNISDIFKFAHKKGLDVVYVASQGQLDKYDKKYPQIGEWIDYLAKSEFVVTNSFHCTVFALLYKKKIMSIPLVKEYKRMNVRITELLQESNLISSIYRGDIDKIYNQIVDFSSFQEYKEREIGNTESYLSAILKKWN